MPEIAGVYRLPLQALDDRAQSDVARVSEPAPGVRPKALPLGEVLQGGQLLELSGQAPGKLSTVVRLMVRAQAAGEPVAYVGLRDASFMYPPDAAEAGIDLAALVLVRLPPNAAGYGLVRAAELLLRSGAFGLVIIDLEHAVPKGELAWQSRLSGLARMHDARVVLLTRAAADAPSLGPLVALRVAAHWETRGEHAWLTPDVIKSKLGAATALSPDVRTFPRGAL